MFVENRVFNEVYRAFNVSMLGEIIFDIGLDADNYPKTKTDLIHALLFTVHCTPGLKGRFLKSAVAVNNTFDITSASTWQDWQYYE